MRMLDDPRAVQAFQEEVPLTATSLGVNRDVDYVKLRERHSDIVNRRNNPLTGLLQCDCCLSQKSYPEEKN